MKYLKVFTDFIETLNELTDDEAGRLFRAMLKYADNGTDPALSGNERYVWGFAKLTIDRTRAYSDSKAEAGRSGGIAKASKLKQSLASPSLKEKKGKEIERLSKESRKKFTPPTLNEVAEFIRASGYTVDPERFVNYYSANGWKVGKNAMKDWKAAVRNWQSNEPKRSSQYTNAELEKLEIVL